MKKRISLTLLALVCALICAFGLAACGKELNYLKADNGDGNLKTQFDFGSFASTDIDKLNEELGKLTFYYEYYPDFSTEKADMSKVKVKYFINNDEYEGLPEKLEKDTHYKIYYYYEGHEPTAGWSDTFSVSVSFSVTS